MSLILDGSANTIAGLAVGGLPDGSVATADLADASVTPAKISGGTGTGNLTQYTTATTPLPASGIGFTGSHSLGVVPTEAFLELTCLTAEFGYSIGDTVTPLMCWTGTVITAHSVWRSTTNVGAFQGAGVTVCIQNKSTGAAVSPTLANWSYRFRVRAA